MEETSSRVASLLKGGTHKRAEMGEIKSVSRRWEKDAMRILGTKAGERASDMCQLWKLVCGKIVIERVRTRNCGIWWGLTR